jgi:hypothetical protein
MMSSESQTTTSSVSSVLVSTAVAAAASQEHQHQQQLPADTTRIQRRKDLFGDCALVEIIHLHDCLRGALQALERDVTQLSQTVLHKTTGDDGDRTTNNNNNNNGQKANELECRVAGRFKVIWSVFRAHSSAEDEFIWPTLQLKTQGHVKGSPSYRPDQQHHQQHQTQPQQQQPQKTPPRGAVVQSESSCDDEVIEQEEYEEDHADEERMFSRMDDLLAQLREGLLQQQQQRQRQFKVAALAADTTSTADTANQNKTSTCVDDIMKAVQEQTKTLSQHLMVHLEKEENQCMPLVVKHLSKSEIHDLVGKIMGKRSSDMIAQIMTMAVQNLNNSDRLEMVKYMKQAMAGTFFDRWLSMSGWMPELKDDADKKRAAQHSNDSQEEESSSSSPNTKRSKPNGDDASSSTSSSALPPDTVMASTSSSALVLPPTILTNPAGEITSQAELEKLIRAIATNTNLTAKQKNTTIQGLRDSVWKSNQRHSQSSDLSSDAQPLAHAVPASSSDNISSSAALSATPVPVRRVTPPSIYYKKNADGKLQVVWNR